MECPTADYLVELAVERALDEPLKKKSQDVQAHLETCPHCAARFRDYLRIAKGLRPILGARPEYGEEGPCLDAATIAAYVDRHLGATDRWRVEHHAAQCRHCLHQLIELEELVRHAPSSDKPHAFVIGLGPQGLAMLAHPEHGFAMIREIPVAGQTASKAVRQIRWTQHMGDVDLAFQVSLTNSASVDLKLTASRQPPLPRGGKIQFFRDGRVRHEAALDAQGTIRVERLRLEDYEVEISLPGAEPQRFALQFIAA